MAESLFVPQNATRAEVYSSLVPQIQALIADEPDEIANMANVSAVLKAAFGFLWVGFFINKGGTLVLGPFQGPLACTRIPFDKGVCGAAATQQKTLVVPDVDAFPGHIACSSISRSEIVVPKVVEGQTRWVLDVDAVNLNDFDAVDQAGLEAIVALMNG